VTPAGSGRVVTIGEPLVGLISTDGPLASSITYSSVVTGAEVNVAIALARLGHRVDFLGCVGADALGERVLRTLRAEQVGTNYVKTVSDADTGILVREPAVFGPTEVLYHRDGSAGSLMDAAYVDQCSAAFRDASWLHVTGITPALTSTCAEAVGRAIDLARRNDLKVSLDVNMRNKLWTVEKAHAALRNLIPMCNLIFGDSTELAVLAGTSETGDAIQRLHHLGAQDIVLKRGAQGAIVHSKASPAIELPGIRLHDIRDLVGAGDAFVAGYLSALLDFQDGCHAEALEPDYGRACLVAAFTMGAVGDSTQAPTRAKMASARSVITQ